MPQQREQVFNSGFNIQEPEYVPPGRYTLTQIVECLADHYKDKQTYSAKVLANRLNIDEQIMGVYLKKINNNNILYRLAFLKSLLFGLIFIFKLHIFLFW